VELTSAVTGFDGTCYSNSKRGDYNPQNNRHLITKWGKYYAALSTRLFAAWLRADNPYEQTVYWTLESDKSDAFYADILNATGIPKNKIGFGLYTDADYCGGTGAKVGNGADCWNSGYEFGAPFPNGYSARRRDEPKRPGAAGADQLGQPPWPDHQRCEQPESNGVSRKRLPGHRRRIVAHNDDCGGVESMSLVIQTADKIEEEERKALILAFIGAILFFVPIAGEVLAL